MVVIFSLIIAFLVLGGLFIFKRKSMNSLQKLSDEMENFYRANMREEKEKLLYIALLKNQNEEMEIYKNLRLFYDLFYDQIISNETYEQLKRRDNQIRFEEMLIESEAEDVTKGLFNKLKNRVSEVLRHKKENYAQYKNLKIFDFKGNRNENLLMKNKFF